MNTDAYDNSALCREDDSQRIFPECADTGIVGLPRGYRLGTSTARNYFDELITLRGFLLTSATWNFHSLAIHSVATSFRDVTIDIASCSYDYANITRWQFAFFLSPWVLFFLLILNGHIFILSLWDVGENYSLLFRLLFESTDIIRPFLTVKSYPTGSL